MIIKALNEDGTPYHHVGHGQWSLPVQNEDGSWTPGEWMPPIVGNLVPCENGYHGCDDAQIFDWFAPALFEMEVRGEVVLGDNKLVAREARLLRRLNWNERIARLFACDCAERVLPLFEREYPGDARPRQAIKTARRFANGEATNEELAAARAAARAAAGAAAGTAGAAAWDAAGAAARAAAWAAAGTAGAAARAAAWAAAGTAGAAGAAAGAAGAAERAWQFGRLVEYLEGER